MAHRTKEGQKVHDQKVAELTRGLKNRGYKVQADLPGHPKPPVMRGYIPDVVAVKGKKTLIREVETPGTVQADKEQHHALEKAAQELGAEFRVIIAKKKS